MASGAMLKHFPSKYLEAVTHTKGRPSSSSGLGKQHTHNMHRNLHTSSP